MARLSPVNLKACSVNCRPVNSGVGHLVIQATHTNQMSEDASYERSETDAPLDRVHISRDLR